MTENTAPSVCLDVEKFDFQYFTSLINQRISHTNYGTAPEELYQPISYIMGLGAKRLRPMLSLIAAAAYEVPQNQALQAAIAVECFHNFTLMHDDIMDKAPLRRGAQTVHKKWNENIAILSGDVMLVKVYEFFLTAGIKNIDQLLLLFNQCATGVCEGQQLDMNFEKLPEVSFAQYIEMIEKKTAILLGFSLRLGAFLGNAPLKDQLLFEQIGINIGLAFQLKDDLMDTYPIDEGFGKQVGGDILANKKTCLLIHAQQNASEQDKALLTTWLNKSNFIQEEKIQAVKQIFDNAKAPQACNLLIAQYFKKAFEALEQLSIAQKAKELLHSYAIFLMERIK